MEGKKYTVKMDKDGAASFVEDPNGHWLFSDTQIEGDSYSMGTDPIPYIETEDYSFHATIEHKGECWVDDIIIHKN